MSTYVLMRWLESAPGRYDRGLKLLSRGRIEGVYEAIAERVAAPGRRILDIGCGTGGVALACAARGARVSGIDHSTEMLAVARVKPVPEERGGSVEWLELGAAEIEDRFEPETFDAVVGCLVFSELSPDERRYVLPVTRERLVARGRLVLVDEVLPQGRGARLGYRVRRLPLAALTYVLTQTTIRALEDPGGLVEAAGFTEVVEEPLAGDLTLVSATRPQEPPS